jgi:tryptophan-rich sensory protein
MGSLLARGSTGWLLGFLGLTFTVATLGGAATSMSVGSWYRGLRKPSWNPPSWVFGPVWTTLYILMAVSAWLTRRGSAANLAQDSGGKAALLSWLVQLALNLAWSMIFFGRRSVGGGVATIVALWLAIAATAGLTARVTKPGAALLMPYLAWTTFAGFLNYRIWQLNRG